MPVGAVGNAHECTAFSKELVGAFCASTAPPASTGFFVPTFVAWGASGPGTGIITWNVFLAPRNNQF